jgi:hypothetical protein
MGDPVRLPVRWVYGALSVADHFRAAALHDGSSPDPRLADAIEVIRTARQPEGTWIEERRHPGVVRGRRVARRTVKWLTFYGTRVSAWWDEHQLVGTP